jgi:hypothetical protein
LLGIDSRPLLAVTTAESRMQLFWLSIRRLPPSIIFLDHLKMDKTPGFSWASASILFSTFNGTDQTLPRERTPIPPLAPPKAYSASIMSLSHTATPPGRPTRPPPTISSTLTRRQCLAFSPHRTASCTLTHHRKRSDSEHRRPNPRPTTGTLFYWTGSSRAPRSPMRLWYGYLVSLAVKMGKRLCCVVMTGG